MSEILKKLYIEPTSRCNLHCKMCFRETWVGESFADMDMDVFMHAMDTMPDSVETVFFGGMGEPMFHPRFFDMLEKAKGKGKRAELLTNGTLLTRENSERLIKMGLDRLWVSVDSLSEKEDEHKGHTPSVTRNIDIFNKLRAVYSPASQLNSASSSALVPCRLGIAFVVMKSNISDLKYLPEYIRLNRVNDVNVSNLIPTDPKAQDEVLYERLLGSDLHCDSFDESRASISIPYLDWNEPEARDATSVLLGAYADISIGQQLLRRKNRWCKFVEEGNCFVRYDGDVSPCMMLLHSAKSQLYNDKRMVWHHSFGNVRSERLDDIWNSDEYKAFRERVRGFEFSPCIRCGGCDNRLENCEDCFGNGAPTCGGCLWSEGIVTCP